MKLITSSSPGRYSIPASGPEHVVVPIHFYEPDDSGAGLMPSARAQKPRKILWPLADDACELCLVDG
jgi:hypothetical protein